MYIYIHLCMYCRVMSAALALACALCCVFAACCSVLQSVAECYSVLQCVAVCCSVLQCVAVCCSVLQFGHAERPLEEKVVRMPDLRCALSWAQHCATWQPNIHMYTYTYIYVYTYIYTYKHIYQPSVDRGELMSCHIHKINRGIRGNPECKYRLGRERV